MNTNHTPTPGEIRITRAEWYEAETVALRARVAELEAALQAIVKITDGSQPKDYPGALMVARAALKLA